jgi:hypothetical protein
MAGKGREMIVEPGGVNPLDGFGDSAVDHSPARAG